MIQLLGVIFLVGAIIVIASTVLSVKNPQKLIEKKQSMRKPNETDEQLVKRVTNSSYILGGLVLLIGILFILKPMF